MYKTLWHIDDGEFKTVLTYYHFGKEPKFPTWYMKEGTTYEIEVICTLKLVSTLKIFFKCLFHDWIIH